PAVDNCFVLLTFFTYLNVPPGPLITWPTTLIRRLLRDSGRHRPLLFDQDTGSAAGAAYHRLANLRESASESAARAARETSQRPSDVCNCRRRSRIAASARW